MPVSWKECYFRRHIKTETEWIIWCTFLIIPWSSKYLVYLWRHGTVFTITPLYLFLKCWRSALKSLDSLWSAESIRKLSIKSNTKHSPTSAGGKRDSPNIFFKNRLTSQSLLLAETQRFHFPAAALKTDLWKQLVNLACKNTRVGILISATAR